ncbi:hypothetical protein MNEG_11705, partial [Monoraphidium neglectum]
MAPPADGSLYDQAVKFHKQQQFDTAVESYRAHLRARPDDALALAALAAALVCWKGAKA